MVSGIDLKVERVRAGATQRDIGRYMGVSASRVSTIERDLSVPDETVARYKQAVEQFVAEREAGEPLTWRVEMAEHRAPVHDQYAVAKSTARADVRHYPSHRTVEVVVYPTTPAMVLLGYLDGLESSGVSPVVLDAHGTIVNRRIG